MKNIRNTLYSGISKPFALMDLESKLDNDLYNELYFELFSKLRILISVDMEFDEQFSLLKLKHNLY